MRFGYPRSFVSLLLGAFTIVAAPLLIALLSNAMSFERLAGISEQAVHQSVKVTQASRSLAGVITALERSARQYAVAGEATFLDAYRANRANFRAITIVKQTREPFCAHAIQAMSISAQPPDSL